MAVKLSNIGAILLLSAALLAAQQKSPLNAQPGVTHVGARACAGCHADLYREWVRTPMGRSLRPANTSEQLGLAGTAVTIPNPDGSSIYEVAAVDGKLLQSAYAPRPEGGELFRVSYPLEWAIGSGTNGYTYVLRRGSHLFQAPLSYFSRAGVWDLSPGYELADQGFSRPIGAACTGCHAGRPNPVRDRPGLYEDPPFSELSIGCENCHGPGQLHVQAKSHPKGQPDPTIVNPARLKPRLAEDICMRCHQGGDTRVNRPGRTEVDFRPGTWLRETLAILKAVPQPAAAQSDVLEHHAQMKLSRCFTGSRGSLSCFSCHRIHDRPPEDPAAKAAYFRERCFTCHTAGSCAAPAAARQRHDPPDDCSGCHMPKRDTARISHSTLTNHRIVLRPDQPAPPQPSAALPGLPADLEYVNRPESGPAEIPPMMLFQAYGELLGKYPQYAPTYRQALEEAARTSPEDPLVLASLARKALLENTPEGNGTALRHLQAAHAAGYAAPWAFEDMAEVLVRLGREDEAVTTLRRGVQAAPYESKLRKLLALRLINLKRYPEAEIVMRDYVRIFPEDQFMRGLLEKATGGRQ